MTALARRLRVIGAALALACGALWGAAARANTWVLAIANNVGLPGEVELQYAERDATQIVTVLQQLGDVPGDQTVLALGKRSIDVVAMLTKLQARIAAAGNRDTLVVYYSGHADARGLHLAGTVLPYEALELLVRGAPAKVKLLIVDSCRSGGATRVKGVTPTTEFAVRGETSSSAEGTAIITSSAAGEDSHESERLRGSFFTHHLVTALRGAGDTDHNGLVSLGEAYDYAYNQTLRSSGQTAELQHPTFRFDLKGRGDVVLTHTAAHAGASDGTSDGAASLGRLRLGEAGMYLVVEGREKGPVDAEVVVPDGGTTLLLQPRSYLVQARARDAYREYAVRLTAGADVDLATLPFRTVSYARLLRKGQGERKAIHNLMVFGGAQTELVPGAGTAADLTLGYAIDLAWLTFGLRMHVALPTTFVSAPGLSGTTLEWGFGLTAQRFLDLPGFSIGIGLLVELDQVRQAFDTAGQAPTRTAWAPGFGGLLTLQVPIHAGFTLVAEGGPLTLVYQRATLRSGAPVGEETATPLAWRVAGGVLWQF